MPVRSISRQQYFDELSRTSEKFFVPFMKCGVGGNLAPLATRGCEVTGIDLDTDNIVAAEECFAAKGLVGQFISLDFFKMEKPDEPFDLVVCHDVIEHIPDKNAFMQKIKSLIGPDSIVFMSFPAWHMPFGGHHQNCRNRFVSHCPYIHLLPRWLYRKILQWAGEREGTVKELLEIKSTGTTVESFERICSNVGFRIVERCLYFINPHYETKFGLYFINPHYETKFGLKPRKLWSVMAHIPYLRNFFTTSCFYMLS